MRTPPVFYIDRASSSSVRLGRVFPQGCGGISEPDGILRPGPVAMFCSPPLWPIMRAARAQGRDWYYGDHGYFGRGQYFRFTRNAYQHDGRGSAGPGRFSSFGITVKPWRKTGSHVVVVPHNDTFHRLMGHESRDAWILDVIEELLRFTDRPIRVRVTRDGRPLSEDLRDAWALVTFMSNSAVEAALAGIPVICTGNCAGLPMGCGDLSRIESPEMPDGRERVAWNLASNQWTLSEIKRGLCWSVLSWRL